MMEKAALRNEISRQKTTSVSAKPESEKMAAGIARPLSQIDRAIEEFDGPQAAPAIPPDIIEILLKNASILIEARDFRLALNLLRNLLMRMPEHPVALERMGFCLREEQRYDEALKCFRALAKVQARETGSSIEAKLMIAETLYLNERDPLALNAYHEVLKNPIGDIKVLFETYKNIGNIHVRAGDYDSAEEFYNKAFTIDPNSDVLMVNYGTLEIQRENLEAAVQRFRRSVEINPENDKGWVGLALVHRQMGDLELAWANVQRALDINRKNRTAIRLLIDWAVAEFKFSEAIERLQDYLEVDGEDAEMSFMLAKIFTHVGRLQEARLEMERVLALDPAIEGGDALVAGLERELVKDMEMA